LSVSRKETPMCKEPKVDARRGWLANARPSVALLVLVVSCGEEPETYSSVASNLAATEPDGQNVGSDIPPGKVLTPIGLVDAECSWEVPFDAVADDEGNVTRNGVVIARHRPCTPEQMGRGKAALAKAAGAKGGAGDSLQPPTIPQAWVDDTWAMAGFVSGLKFYNYMKAEWTVPRDPPWCIWGCPLLYYFPSFTSTNNEEILQPVLQHGNNGEFGGNNSWAIASWYCLKTACQHSPPLAASAGENLLGQIQITSNSPLKYWIATSNLTRGYYTYLDANTPKGPFTNVQGGVMEVWRILTCGQYPQDHALTFHDILVQQAGPTWNTFNTMVPAWSTQVKVGQNLNPFCNYGAQASVDGGTLLSTATVTY
jgi:hypothetical protein